MQAAGEVGSSGAKRRLVRASPPENHAEVLYLLGDLDEAERHYTALIAMDSTNPGYLASVGDRIEDRPSRLSTLSAASCRQWRTLTTRRPHAKCR